MADTAAHLLVVPDGVFVVDDTGVLSVLELRGPTTNELLAIQFARRGLENRAIAIRSTVSSESLEAPNPLEAV